MNSTDKNNLHMVDHDVDARQSVQRQNPIDEHNRMPAVPVSIAWLLCVLVFGIGGYSISQVGNPANSWVATIMFGAITLATLMIAGRVLTPVDLRLDRLLRVFTRSRGE